MKLVRNHPIWQIHFFKMGGQNHQLDIEVVFFWSGRKDETLESMVGVNGCGTGCWYIILFETISHENFPGSSWSGLSCNPFGQIPSLWVNDGGRSIARDTPRKSNIDSQDSHVAKEIHFQGDTHHFWYQVSMLNFWGVDEVEPNCAMGFWVKGVPFFWKAWFCQALIYLEPGGSLDDP